VNEVWIEQIFPGSIDYSTIDKMVGGELSDGYVLPEALNKPSRLPFFVSVAMQHVLKPLLTTV
jgi:hypothetical protein